MPETNLNIKRFKDFDFRDTNGNYHSTNPIAEVTGDAFLVGYRIEQSGQPEFRVNLTDIKPNIDWSNLQFSIVDTTDTNGTTYTLYYTTEENPGSAGPNNDNWTAVSDPVVVPNQQEIPDMTAVSYQTTFYLVDDAAEDNLNWKYLSVDDIKDLDEYEGSFAERPLPLIALVTAYNQSSEIVAYFWYYIPYFETQTINTYVSNLKKSVLSDTTTLSWDKYTAGVPSSGSVDLVTHLDQLENVTLGSTVSNGQVLMYSSSTGNWYNADIITEGTATTPIVEATATVEADPNVDGIDVTVTDSGTAPNAQFDFVFKNLTAPYVTGITNEGTDNNITTYEMHFSDGREYTFTVTNGANGAQGATGPTGPTGPAGTNGNGIASITGPVSNGLVDTYTINYTNGTTSTFTVTNGANGTNGTNGVDGVDGADGADGVGIANVTIDGIYNSASGATNTYNVIGTNGNTLGTFSINNGVAVLPNVAITEPASGQHQIVFSSVTGDSTVTILDGADGADGTNGADGADGTTFKLFRIIMTNNKGGYLLSDSGTTGDNVDGSPTYYGFDNLENMNYTISMYDSNQTVVMTHSEFDDFIDNLIQNTSDVIDVFPDYQNPSSMATSLSYGLYGALTNANLRFYSIKPIVSNSAIAQVVFTIKAYSEIDTSSF